MLTSNVNSYYDNNKKNTSFKKQIGLVTDIPNRIPCYGNTLFFRDDIVWNRFAQFLAEKYKNVPKVNFINHACSSGEEPYSVAMKLIADLGADANKFFPIIARDLSPINIQTAQDGRIIGDYYEKAMIDAMTAPKTDSLIKSQPVARNTYLFLPTYKLKDKIEFSVGNILKDIERISDKNTVLFCRNVWQYLEDNERDYLMSRIAENFKDDSSILFVGQADMDNSNFSYLTYKYNLVDAGFPFAYVKGKGSHPLAKYITNINEVKGL